MRAAGAGIVSLVPRPGGHGLAFETMIEVVIYVCSAFLTMCLAQAQLGTCEAQYWLSTNAKIKSNSATAAYHWIEENKTDTMMKSLSQTVDNSAGDYILCISWVYFAGNIPRQLLHFTIYRFAGYLASVRLFVCSECNVVRYIKCCLSIG